MIHFRPSSELLEAHGRDPLMASDDVAYYRERAETERALAKNAGEANVAAIHAELARQYQALVDREDLRPVLRISFPATRPRQAEKVSSS